MQWTKMFCVFIVICLSLDLVNGIPTNYLESTANENNIPSAIILHEIERKTLSNNDEDSQVSNNHNVIMLSDSELADIIFENPVQTSCNQDGVESGLATHFNLLNQDKLPIRSDQYPKLTQEGNHVYDEQEPVKISMDIFMNNYDDDDNELPNPILPLDFLPKNYPTYVHRTVPKAGENNDIDILSNQNNEDHLPNTRPNRSEDDEYARIIADLEHDAMLNNILPTMSFLRGAVDYDNPPALQAAIFPTRTSTGCGLPILLGLFKMCPANETMGANLQCGPRKIRININESHWKYYDEE